MRQARLLGLVLCGLVLWTAGGMQRRSSTGLFQATPNRAALGAFDHQGQAVAVPLSSQSFLRTTWPTAKHKPRVPTTYKPQPGPNPFWEWTSGMAKGETPAAPWAAPSLPTAQVREATGSPQPDVAARSMTGIGTLLYALSHPPTDRQGWIAFSDKVIVLNALVWLLFGLSFMLLPGEMAAQVALFEGVPSGVELNSIAASTDYRASIGGIQVGAGLYLLTMLARQRWSRPEVQQICRYHSMSLCLFVWLGIVGARGVGLWIDGFSWYNFMALVSAEGPLLSVTLAGWIMIQIHDGDSAVEDGAEQAQARRVDEVVVDKFEAVVDKVDGKVVPSESQVVPSEGRVVPSEGRVVPSDVQP